MATMDIFENDAFRARELGAAINLVPNQWGRIGELGLFMPKPLRVPAFQLESKEGKLVLVQSSARGTPLPPASTGRRKMRNFNTSRFGQIARIIADDIAGIRAFGSETELAQVMDEVNDRQLEIRQNMDITREYLRAGAIAGVIKDADGTTLWNLFTEFGITQKVVDFDLGSAAGALASAQEVKTHIKKNLRGDMATGVRALCSEGFWDKLMANAEFKEAWKYYTSTVAPLREGVGDEGIYWQGITWELYVGEGEVPQEDGTSVTQSFIAAGDCRFIPEGTRNTFHQFNAPADYTDTVGTPGVDFYSAILPDVQSHRFVDVEGQMNTVPICVQPAVLVRGHSTT